jgi:hypothetical protein
VRERERNEREKERAGESGDCQNTGSCANELPKNRQRIRSKLSQPFAHAKETLQISDIYIVTYVSWAL